MLDQTFGDPGTLLFARIECRPLLPFFVVLVPLSRLVKHLVENGLSIPVELHVLHGLAIGCQYLIEVVRVHVGAESV